MFGGQIPTTETYTYTLSLTHQRETPNFRRYNATSSRIYQQFIENASSSYQELFVRIYIGVLI